MADIPAIGLLISDVDGTLVRHDKTLADATVAAFARLRAAGIPATLISARPPSGIHWLADALGIDVPIGAFNGGTLFMRDGTIIAATRLDGEVVRMALAILDDAGVDVWMFAGGKWYARTLDNPHVPRERLSAGIEPSIVADLASLAEVDKIVGVSDDVQRLVGVEEKVKAAAGGAATVARSQTYFLDITAPTANKGAGVSSLADAIGVPLAAVAVIGDMSNDLPMFAKAGLSIAMGQAPDAVRSAADHVTASNDEDGVAAAIDAILLPAAAGRPGAC